MEENHPITKAIKNRDPKEMKHLYHRAFDSIMKTIDRLEVNNKQYYQEMLATWV